MSRVTSLKENLVLLKKEWEEVDPTLRFLDLISIGLIGIFGIGYILVNVLEIIINVSNGVMLIFPLILSGYIFVLRSKLADPKADNDAARREFLMLVGITLFLVLLTFVYSILLNQVLL